MILTNIHFPKNQFLKNTPQIKYELIRISSPKKGEQSSSAFFQKYFNYALHLNATPPNNFLKSH